MSDPSAEPRDIQSERDPEYAHLHAPGPQAVPGRWQRDAEAPHEAAPQDPATKRSRVLFFVMLGIIAAAIALFLIFHPQPGD